MLSRKASIACLLISAITLFAAVEARSQSLASAKILSSEGPVEIHRPSQGKGLLTKITYRANDELFAGDIIKTFRGGRLVLGLLDGSQAIIGELTTLEIMDTSTSPRTIFNVLRGKTRVRIEKVGGRPNPYRVNTPTTVIAVRGTIFDVIVTEKETQVFVHEGEVAVANFARPEITVILSPGMRTRVQQTQPPESPSRFKPGRNDIEFDPAGPGKNLGDSRRGEKKEGGQSAEEGADSDRKGQKGAPPAQDSKSPGQRPPGDGQRPSAQPPPPPPSRPGFSKQRDARRESSQFFSDNS